MQAMMAVNNQTQSQVHNPSQPQQQSQQQPIESPLVARITTDPLEIQQALELRFKVFAQDMGAHVKSAAEGIDKDYFDDYCHHLIVKDVAEDQVVGYSRILTCDMLPQVGRFYSATEFDLNSIIKSDKSYMEIGRTCVDPDFRSGAVIGLLWSGIAQYMVANKFDYLMGCASISMSDGGAQANAIVDHLREKHFSAETLRTTPKISLPTVSSELNGKQLMPSLLKAYLRIGAKICGEAFFDQDFNVADVLILLPKEDINQRYMRHFFKG